MKRKIKQIEISIETGIHKSVLSSQIYHGRRPVTIQTAKKLGRYLSLEWTAFLTMQRRQILSMLKREYKDRHYNKGSKRRAA